LRATKSSSGAQFSLAKQSAGVYQQGYSPADCFAGSSAGKKPLSTTARNDRTRTGGFSLMNIAASGWQNQFIVEKKNISKE